MFSVEIFYSHIYQCISAINLVFTPHAFIDVTEEGIFYDGATTDLSYSLKDFIKNAFAEAGQFSNLYPYLDEESIHLYPYGGSCQIVDNPFPDPTYPEGQTAPGTPLSPPVIIIPDSLYKKYPCASLIITGLQGIREYADLVAPFQQDLKPNLIWRSDNLIWNPNGGGQTMLGNTSVDLSGGLGLGSVITLNNNMMNNSSRLLIAAVSIHETIHAYINFNVSLAHANSDPNYTFNGSWMNELDFFYDQNALPPNYRDHYEMMSDYFVKAVYILSTFDNNLHTQREYIMAMLYGLNTPDPTSTPQQINNLQRLYGQMLVNYGISESDLSTFWKSQFIVPVSGQLPKSGC